MFTHYFTLLRICIYPVYNYNGWWFEFIGRSQSLTSLSRSQSMQSLNGRRNFNNSDGGSSGGRGRFINRNSFNRPEFKRGVRGKWNFNRIILSYH